MNSRLLKVLKDRDFAELFQQGGLSFLIRIAGQLMGFLMSFLIAYYYDAEALGNFMLALIFLRVFTLIPKLGIDTASVKLIASFAKQKKWGSIIIFRKKTLTLVVITSIISSVMMYFLSPILAPLFNMQSEYLELASFFILPMSFFVLHYQSLRGLKRIAEFSFFYRVSQSLFAIISIFIIYQFNQSSEVPIYAYLTSLVLVSFLSFISYQFWFYKMAELDPEEVIEDLGIKKILKISIPLMLAQSVQFIMAWTDKLMLGNMMEADSVAVYSVAFRFSMIVSVTLMAINSIAAPKFAENFATNNIDRMGNIAMQSAKMIFWTSFPLAVILLIFPDFFMGLYGKEFLTSGGVVALQLLVIGRVVNAFSGSVGNLMQMSGQQNNYMLVLFFGAVINVGLNLLLIPEENPFSHFGIKGISGAAIASIVSLSFWNLSMVYLVKRRFGFSTIYIPFISK